MHPAGRQAHAPRRFPSQHTSAQQPNDLGVALLVPGPLARPRVRCLESKPLHYQVQGAAVVFP